MSVTYVRWAADQDRRSPVDRFPVMTGEAAFVDTICVHCFEPLQVGQRPGLFAVGPTNPEDVVKFDAGRWFNALAAVVHQDCIWPPSQVEMSDDSEKGT